jgi:hypothetical protein
MALDNQSWQKPSIWSGYWKEFVILLIGLACMNGIFLSKAFRQSGTVDPEGAAQLGSFVGGFVGAMFALIGVVLLFATLRTQRDAFLLQSFENRYFALIQMHRDNVAEVDLRRAAGRKLFVWLVRELRCALEVVRVVDRSHASQLNKEQLLHVAYYCVFYGVGPNSSRMLKISLSEFDKAFVDAVEVELNKDETKERYRAERHFPYKPFEGHQSRLGHYYRHLYQMVQYVDQRELKINKYSYVKTIRAQLSTHEQAMLLVNSRTPLGRKWWSERLIDRYKLVKNIPRDFFDKNTELDADSLFDSKYFEWQTNV